MKKGKRETDAIAAALRDPGWGDGRTFGDRIAAMTAKPPSPSRPATQTSA